MDEGFFSGSNGSSASQGMSPVLPPPVRSADMCMGVEIGLAGSIFIDQPSPVRLATRIVLIEICDPCTMLTAAVSQGSVEVFGHFTSAFNPAQLVSAVAPEAVPLSSPFELSVVEFARLSQNFVGCFFVLFAGVQLFEYDCFERGADVFRMASEVLFCNSGGMAWSAACLGEASGHNSFMFRVRLLVSAPSVFILRWIIVTIGQATLASCLDPTFSQSLHHPVVCPSPIWLLPHLCDSVAKLRKACFYQQFVQCHYHAAELSQEPDWAEQNLHRALSAADGVQSRHDTQAAGAAPLLPPLLPAELHAMCACGTPLPAP